MAARTRHDRHGLRARVAGQALTEFVIGAVLFLIPLFLIIPLLGKYADMKASTIQAARYNAWERTVWYGQTASSSGDWEGNDKNESTIKSEMDAKFLNSNLWHDRTGTAMLGGSANSITNNDTPGTANTILGFAVSVANAVGPFTLEMKGLYEGTATVTVANTASVISEVLGSGAGADPARLNLSISDKNVILANGWGANGAAHVKKQVQGLTPTSILSNPVLDAVRWILVPFTPELVPTVLELGKIEVDQVPPDRLGN
ncbi:MAG: hypothetical protein KF804_16395 [Burkholderiales bacterium]|jgi:hypothetical protein|nr:hypothetical protein [Burkholderiales bacterium]